MEKNLKTNCSACGNNSKIISGSIPPQNMASEKVKAGLSLKLKEERSADLNHLVESSVATWLFQNPHKSLIDFLSLALLLHYTPPPHYPPCLNMKGADNKTLQNWSVTKAARKAIFKYPHPSNPLTPGLTTPIIQQALHLNLLQDDKSQWDPTFYGNLS